jgi:plastocyanin
MTRRLLIVLFAFAVAAAGTATAYARQSSTPTLVGTVGPGYTIKLTRNGKAVKTLKHGKYKFVIHDRSGIHGFSMDGPNGFDKDFTAIAGTANKTVTVTLKAGKYKYYCPAHESQMFGNFKAT